MEFIDLTPEERIRTLTHSSDNELASILEKADNIIDLSHDRWGGKHYVRQKTSLVGIFKCVKRTYDDRCGGGTLLNKLEIGVYFTRYCSVLDFIQKGCFDENYTLFFEFPDISPVKVDHVHTYSSLDIEAFTEQLKKEAREELPKLGFKNIEIEGLRPSEYDDKVRCIHNFFKFYSDRKYKPIKQDITGFIA